MKPALLVVLLVMLCIGCARKNFFATSPLVYTDEITPTLPPGKDSVMVQAGKHYRHGKIFSLLFGKHYRNVWAAPVQARVLRLQEEKGGLKIEKVGGSMQTTSFTLSDKDGMQYALRMVDKDPAGTLPGFLQKTIIASFLRDQTAALNPYAALVVAPLAQVAGIPHANPELVYLPADSLVLGKYYKLAGDKLYLLEEKMEQARVLQEDTIGLKKIVDSEKLLQKRFKHNTHHVDQLAFAKARLFDLFINDRDRHVGQWNWAAFKRGNMTSYKPVPKDRDQAFYKFANGLLPRIVGRGLNYQKFISFRRDFGDMEALLQKSKYVDEHFLSEVTQAEFDSLAIVLKDAFSDSVIESAVAALPKAAYKEAGTEMTMALKSRRDLLPEAAKAFYKLLAEEVTVAGTDDEEHFIVERMKDGKTEVTVLRENKTIMYYRIFDPAETKKIKLNGLGDDDVFEISGKAEKGTLVEIYGGLGEDEITDTSHVKGWKKLTLVFDTANGTKLNLGSEAKDKTTSDVAVHAFNREGI